MNKKTKKLIINIIVFVSVSLLVASVVIAEYSPEKYSLLICMAGFLFLLGGFFAAACIEYTLDKYACRNCGRVFKPKFSHFIFNSHFGPTRYLKCTKCGSKSWCKKFITKK